MLDNSKINVGALIQGLLGHGLLSKFEYMSVFIADAECERLLMDAHLRYRVA